MNVSAGLAAAMMMAPAAAWAAVGQDPRQQLLDEIRNDHDMFKKLVDQLIKADPGQRSPLFTQLKAGLLPHMKAEEAVVYPALEQQPKTLEAAVMGEEEHVAASAVFQDLDKMDKSSPRFVPTMKVLKELLEHHIKEEESKVFSGVKEVFKANSTEALDLYTRFKSEKQKNAQAA
jgi:hemerythrin superfamily protein